MLYRTMLGNSRMGAGEHQLASSSKILCAAPLSHLYGLYSLHCAWSVGACTVLLPAFKPDELAQTVERERPTALWTGPAHVAACRAAGLFDKHDWSSLRLAIVSGSMAPPALVRSFAEKLPGCAVTQLWGMTELQAALYSRPQDGHRAPPRPAPAARVPARKVRVASDGELQVRGPLAFSGYYNNPDANRSAFTDDGWFRLRRSRRGARGLLRDHRPHQGCHQPRRGEVQSADVEALLDSHPQILQSAIVPMPDPVLGEKACAFITLKPGSGEPTLAELVDYLLAKEIAKNKLPERLVVVPEMPLTPTRKIIKGRLRLPG